ncbi:MAG TPA: TetR family transcriptional regulator [Pseudolysinimonas sp.]|nr:TetR family transcriptional regulator [Pseudolysinimonas sp.]
MPEAPARRSRRYDPGRRERIIAAAQTVLERDGLAMFTHRAVAAEADVQIGSLSYYFASKEDLLSAVLESSVVRGVTQLTTQLEELDAGSDLVGALTETMRGLVTQNAEYLLMSYEMFVAVRRRPQLSHLAARWPSIEYSAILAYTNPTTARILTDVFEGMLVQFVMFGREFRDDEVREALQRVIG